MFAIKVRICIYILTRINFHLKQVMDIVIHCLDHTQLKARGLKETFPAICRFVNFNYEIIFLKTCTDVSFINCIGINHFAV